MAQRLHIHIATFNMCGKVPVALPAGMLGAPGQQQQQGPEQPCQQVDLYVFATQVSNPDVGGVSRQVTAGTLYTHILSETAFASMAGQWQARALSGACACTSALQPGEGCNVPCCLPQESGSISEWERLLAASLPPDGEYERIAWQSLRAIHLVLFASKRFRRQVLSIRGSAVATGIGNLVGNKVSSRGHGGQQRGWKQPLHSCIPNARLAGSCRTMQLDAHWGDA
jgi:hypothetical protein